MNETGNTTINCDIPLAEAATAEGFCAEVIPVTLDRPRSILSVTKDEFLVFQRGNDGEVIRVFDSDGDGVPDEAAPIGARGGNHGLAYRDGYIYTSSDAVVWRWRYDLGQSSVYAEEKETVVVNVDKDGQGGAPNGHTTRTLIFDDEGRLYISVGSAGNVDEDSHRSRIRRIVLPGNDEEEGSNGLPLDFQTAEVFADGLRNEVGLGFDRHGVLWGVENGADRLMREDLGGDIHNDNPGEELNRFPESMVGSHWGYPDCWSEYLLDDSVALGRGTQWAWPSKPVSDEECRNNRVPSELSMQAHSAPLGIVFYNHTSTHPEGCSGAFPESMDGYAFIAFHGSWNRDIPTGYKVVYVPMTKDGFVNATDPIDLLYRNSSETSAKWDSGYRPVDVDFDECGRLLVTSDGTNGRGSNIVRIAYENSFCCYSDNVSVGAIINAPSTAGMLLIFLLSQIYF